MSRATFTVRESANGEKLATFLQKSLEGELSLKKIRRWLDSGLCTVNGRKETFHHTRLQTKDRVEIIIPEEKEPITSKILFEDAAIIVIDKAPGVACDIKLEQKMKALLVHRLDKDTSGVLLLAKKKEGREYLFEQFKERQVNKEYLALVDGVMGKKKGDLTCNLREVQRLQGQTIWGVAKSGIQAIMSWQVECEGKQATLVRLFPETGRMHQLRVQLSYLGHPILGDKLYGRERAMKCRYPAERQLLHAEKLSFCHPITKERMEVMAPLPEDFQKAVHTCVISL